MNNRVIKFRGKRKDNGEWVYGYYVIDPKGNHRIYWQPFEEASSNTYHFVIPESVGQFVGRSNTGKDIYEDDIMDFGDNRAFYVQYVGNQFVASFSERVINTAIPIYNFHIIGNRIDNPELLTSKPNS